MVDQSKINEFVCSKCGLVLYKNGLQLSLPIECACGQSRIDFDGEGGATYTNVLTIIDGITYTLE